MRPDFKNLTGQKFSRLTCIDYFSKFKYTKKVTFWNCICECGNKITLPITALTSGNTKSCGCLHKDTHYKLPIGEAGFNKLFARIKSQASMRGFKFYLEKEYVKELSKKNCHYCGDPPRSIMKSKNGNYIYNGIDRMNNNFGYTNKNSITCCGRCNILKGVLPYKTFIIHIRKIYNEICKY